MRWPKVQLAEVCRIVSGATPKTSIRDYWAGEIPWTTPADLSKLETPYISDTPRKITEAGLKSCAASLLPEGSILLSSRAPIGHVAINTTPMATNQGFKSLIPDETRVSSKFLYHWLVSKRTHLQNLGKGATFKEISKTIVSRVEFPLPPIDEQRRIAEILDKADALRQKRKQAITLLDGLTQSIFLDMFGDPVSNPHGHQLKSLGQVSKFISGGTPTKNISKYWNGNMPWVSPKDMKVPEVNTSQEHVTPLALQNSSLRLVPKKSVLLVVRGMILAHTVPLAITNCTVTINQDMKAICFSEEIDPDFGHWCLRVQQNYILSKVSSAAHGTKRLDMSDVRGLPVLAPSMSKQTTFTRAARQVQNNIAAARSFDRKIEHAFASLQHRAFSGGL